MTIKEARKIANLSQAETATLTGIPIKTLQHWEAFENNPESSGAREPGKGIKELVVDKILNYNKPQFKIRNSSVEKYAEICKKFAEETADWGGLDEYKFYTTDGFGWTETADNANNGADVSWAFNLSADEIEQRAAEELFEQLMNELDLADSDNWDSDGYKNIYDKFNF